MKNRKGGVMKCKYELNHDDIKKLISDRFNVDSNFVTLTVIKEIVGQGMDEHTEHCIKCFIECNDRRFEDILKSELNPHFSAK